jgi:hypothetical protein
MNSFGQLLTGSRTCSSAGGGMHHVKWEGDDFKAHASREGKA